MLTFDEARLIALNEIGPECALYENNVIEKPYGWYFWFQSKTYMASGNDEDFLVGSGGFIVEKDRGHIVRFGSGYPLENWFAFYEAGLLFNWYNLTIYQMYDAAKTLELLMSLRLMYIIPEEENGVTWKIPQSYTTKQIQSKISSLPCHFSGIWFQDLPGTHRTFQSINSSGCCTYKLTGHYDKHPVLA